MSASTRRGVLAALLGMGLLGAGPLLRPVRASSDLPLRLPDRSLRLTRLLERGLGDDGAAAIIVRRWWEVSFARQARGIVVTGQQVGAEVSAPPRLAELARIEQQRNASDMFPLMLSEDGAIITPPAAPSRSDAVAEAMRAAEAVIARQKLPADERAMMRNYLAEVHRAGSGLLNALPEDLLFPAGVPVDRSETMALPGGISGQFAMHYSAVPQPDAPWLAHAERRATTRIGTMERSAAETWTLGPA